MFLNKNIIRTIILGRNINSNNNVLKQNKSTKSQLIVTPSYSLVDSPLSVKGVDLPPSAPVTLITKLTSYNERFNFSSVCRYKTTTRGTLDISRQPTLRGSSYEGIHAMGPFWSLQPEENSSKRLWPKDIRTPLDYCLNLTDESGEILCSAEVKKTFMSEGVERILFKEGRVRGTLFSPSSRRPAPAIVTLYGGINRNQVPEDRAAMLASCGFVSLALAYFGVDDLPKIYESLDIEYFEEAVDSLLSHRDVVGEGVGLWGLSQGGNISLAMMAFLEQKIRSVVVVGSSFAAEPGSIIYKHEAVKPSDHYCEIEKGILTMTGPVEEHLHDPSRQIKFERSSADLLIISGDDDPCNGGRQQQINARTNLERARLSGKNNCSMLSYPGMGHLLDLPHAPFCSAISNPLLPPGLLMFYGGTMQQHALGQIDAWDKTINFYRRTLCWK